MTRPPYQSQPVLWWHLINAMEAFREDTGMGLAPVWGHVHRGDYDKAQALFRKTRDDYVQYVQQADRTP